MSPWDELVKSVAELKRAIWDDRWSFGVYLGLVWLGCMAWLVWSTWIDHA